MPSARNDILTASRFLAREAVSDGDDRFRLLVDSSQDYAIFMLDPAGRVVTWNLGAKHITGYAEEEVVGRHFSIFYPESEGRAEKCARELALAREAGRVEDEGWRVRKDESEFWADVVTTALRDDGGALVGFAMIVRDVSEQRSADEAVRQGEERLRLLISSLKDFAILTLDPQGRITSCNEGAEKVNGYPESEIVGKHVAVFYSEEDIRAGKCESELDIAARDGRFEDEAFRRRLGGGRMWASVVITALHGPDGTLLGFSKVMRDLTERRRAEEERRRLHQAQEANRIKDEFLATISHELRTPLNAILGWSAMMDATRQHDPSAVAKALEVIGRNARLQAKLVDDMLDVSRIITGKLRLDVKPTNLATIVRDALEVVSHAADAKGVELVCERIDDTAALVGDPARLQQVAWNLLSNAVKFTDSGGSVSVSLEQTSQTFTLSVNDTGRGIEPAFLPYVFERFRQADSSTTRQFGGLGLGLAIVRHIVELHGGQVAAESAGLGTGATFRVILPRSAPAITDAFAEGPTDLRLQTLGANIDGVRVAVIDDDDDARELLATILSARGAAVRTFGSAAAARAALDESPADVLFCDVSMPGEDGYAFIRALRDRGMLTPAIALTAYARLEDRERALAAGFDDHVAKPVDPDALVAGARRLLKVGGSPGNRQ
jgi:PAS domain S-box-containing protein